MAQELPGSGAGGGYALRAERGARERRCQDDLTHRTRGKNGTKEELLLEDRAAFLPLPGQPFEARRIGQAAADSESLVRFDTNSYSVPVKYAHRQITVVATVDEVRLVYDDRLVRGIQEVGEKSSIFTTRSTIWPAGAEAGRLRSRQAAGALGTARQLRLAATPAGGGRQSARHGQFIRVLRLLEKYSLLRLSDAVEYALDIDVLHPTESA